MKLFGREFAGFAKALVILVAVLLVASGLWEGTNALAMRGGGLLFQPENKWGIVLGFLGILELGTMILSAAGIVFVLIAWPVNSIYRTTKSRRVDRLQELLDDRSVPPREESGPNHVD